MRVLHKVGRYIFALAFIGLGVNNIVSGGSSAYLVPNFMPVPTLWVFVTGVAYILAAISIFTNIYSRVACVLLGLLVFLIAFSVHGLNLIHGVNVTANASGFVEALAVAAGAWMAGFKMKSKKEVAAEKRTSIDDISAQSLGEQSDTDETK